MDWRERYERAAARYAAGETRELDERQLVQLANAAWAAGLCLLMDGDREAAAVWLRRAAERYRESWSPGAWGRPIGAMKALLIAGDDADEAARWALDAGAAEAESPIGRYAGALADGFPSDVADALAALAASDADAYSTAVTSVRRSFEERDSFLEDVPVPDTALALDVLASQRFT
jgi:hypothetical protein